MSPANNKKILPCQDKENNETKLKRKSSLPWFFKIPLSLSSLFSASYSLVSYPILLHWLRKYITALTKYVPKMYQRKLLWTIIQRHGNFYTANCYVIFCINFIMLLIERYFWSKSPFIKPCQISPGRKSKCKNWVNKCISKSVLSHQIFTGCYQNQWCTRIAPTFLPTISFQWRYKAWDCVLYIFFKNIF